MGSGSSSVSINKDISGDFALDVSGATKIRGAMEVDSFKVNGQEVNGTGTISTLTVTLDSSLNGKLSVGQDLSVNGNLYVAKRALFSGDVSINANVRLGSGSSLIAVNKDITAGIALDVSGLTVLRNALYVFSDVSFNNKLSVGGDVSFNNKLSVGGDVSFNNKLSVGGDVSFNNKLSVRGDVSFNQNLSVGQDLSLNGNLYVSKRALFLGDVSLNKNVQMGSGSSSVAINKVISQDFALDVNGATKFRGAMDVEGNFTINGVPVSAGSALLTGNVQVGTNNGFVTVDKPYFYLDPLLIIYYDFDTSINGGTQIKNIASASSTYDGVFNVTSGGSTTGMIDTTVFYNGKQNNTSLASFKNNPPSNNFGIRIGAGTVPVSSIMSFSFWVYKKSRTIDAGDRDRVFHFTDSETTTQLSGENNTIALDVISNGTIVPVITKGGGTTPSSLITPSLPIVSYDLGASTWNHVVWTINGTKSSIYINGSLTQNDTLSENITLNTSTTRYIGAIAYSFTNTSQLTRDFSGNIDDFRYYKDKALNYAEIYQLYNNRFYTLDICGGFLANGSSVIYEPVGSKAGANSGSLTLLHGDASGSSSIMFKSVNDPLEYGYIQYEENSAGSTGYHYGLMTIGIENDAGTGASYMSQADRISLFPSGGTGFVGVNTKTPQYSLDVSGTLNTNADATINGVSIGRGAGNVYTNTVVGNEALYSNSGTQNVAVGNQALYTNSGTQTVAVGYEALFQNSGTQNVAVGYLAAGYTNIGSRNTFLGALTDSDLNGNWSNSTAIGYNARITASNQIKLGTNTESTFVGSALRLNPTSTHCDIKNLNTGYNLNFGIGTTDYLTVNASGITVTGTTNAIGPATTYANRISNPLSGGLIVSGTNGGRIVLGSYLTTGALACAIQASDYYLDGGTMKDHGAPLLLNQLGGAVGISVNAITSGYTLDVGGNVQATGYNASSDYRIKKNVVPLDLTFNVDLLKPVSYYLKDDKDAHLNIGFIAHEVQEVYPYLVSGVKDGSFNQSINYNGFIGILTNEIQVLKKKVSDQEARIVEQERKALEQEAQLAEQSAKALDQDQRIQALEKMMMNK
jgi:cytoskeletal protein CcmA (bactofilin family)